MTQHYADKLMIESTHSIIYYNYLTDLGYFVLFVARCLNNYLLLK